MCLYRVVFVAVSVYCCLYGCACIAVSVCIFVSQVPLSTQSVLCATQPSLLPVIQSGVGSGGRRTVTWWVVTTMGLSAVSISFTTAIVYIVSGAVFFFLIFLLVMLGVTDCNCDCSRYNPDLEIALLCTLWHLQLTSSYTLLLAWGLFHAWLYFLSIIAEQRKLWLR